MHKKYSTDTRTAIGCAGSFFWSDHGSDLVASADGLRICTHWIPASSFWFPRAVHVPGGLWVGALPIEVIRYDRPWRGLRIYHA